MCFNYTTLDELSFYELLSESLVVGWIVSTRMLWLVKQSLSPAIFIAFLAISSADIPGRSTRARLAARRVSLRTVRQYLTYGVRTPRSDPHHPLLGLEDVAVPRQLEHVVRVRHQQSRLETPEVLVRPPILGELHTGPHQLPGMLLEFLLQSFEQSQSIRSRTSKANDDALADAPDLLSVALDEDGLSLGDLSVSSHGGEAILANADDGGLPNRLETMKTGPKPSLTAKHV